MIITDEAFDQAKNQAEAMKAAFPVAVSVRYDRRVSRVIILLASGLELAFSPKNIQGLESAHPADLLDAEITPSGLGIYFPRIDADLYIPALLEGYLGTKKWMADQLTHSPVNKTSGKLQAKTALSGLSG
jgi:hypothetical protein